MISVDPVMFQSVFLCSSAYDGAVQPEAALVTGSTWAVPFGTLRRAI